MKPSTLVALLKGDFENAIISATPGGIEDQEKRGQTDFVSNNTLPIKCNYCERSQFEKMGIVFGENIDDLFVEVQLPEGWKKEPTDHSMWSNLLDEQNRKRAMIFYKAAFYDRDAFINILNRYRISSFEYSDKDGNIVDNEISATNFATYILDDEKPLKLIGIRPKKYGLDIRETHEEEAHNWIDKNYPNHSDPLEYW